MRSGRVDARRKLLMLKDRTSRIEVNRLSPKIKLKVAMVAFS
jgi:hypothetical protein